MSKEHKERIQQRINAFATGNLADNAIALFKELGYKSNKRIALDKDAFKSRFDECSDDDMKKTYFDDWLSGDYLFQLTESEITRQLSLFSVNQYNPDEYQSYSFVAIKLKNEHYARGKLSQITREVNKLFPMPVMILFKHGSTLSLSIIDRRPNERDMSRDVLKKVTFIKDIKIPLLKKGGEGVVNGNEGVITHRAHIEILVDLSFDMLKNKCGFTDFVGLHNAWRKTLNTSELNNRFFKELANWYFWATQKVEFPDDAEKDRDIRNATNVIRLITRLTFVWFLKEKGLVPDELFDETQLKKLLKYTDNKKSTYYKAIMQNLFFATLNTEMGKRRFRIKNDSGRDGHYFIHNVFRYENDFVKPKETLEQYFAPIPFLNGGLFECLDKELDDKSKLKRIRIDGFSDSVENVLEVPDELFFNEKGVDVNLSEIYGSPKRSNEKVRGLIDILNSYKFTVTENTPIEEEIALDPELLGKVFENLLANYNQETQTTVRKQTGSFYTPREIVNYMVDESLLAYLKQSLTSCYFDHSNDIINKETLHVIPYDKNEERLRDLLSYSENPNPFNAMETEVLIKAIDTGKILDPACGSGAFPMGILHKLVHILHKLDTNNSHWKQRQLDKVDKLIEESEGISDTSGREKVVEDLRNLRSDIEEAFDNNELDYGRKLYLIENCIYGVDIQPIAVQIAKLRFFISLIVDQKVNPKKDNLGIRPLPNLETKFVAANTLIALEKEHAHLFTNPNIEKKKAELKKVRHDYFEARTPKRKENCRIKDKQLRDELAELLIQNHDFQPATAKIIAAWDPYDQNVSSPFFNPEWMFGIKWGFDVVIGNPPYIRHELIKDLKPILQKTFKVFNSTSDLYTYFYELTYNLLQKNGISAFITNNSWIKAKYGTKLRQFFLENTQILYLINFEDEQTFELAIVETNVLILKKEKPTTVQQIRFAKTIPNQEISYTLLSQNELKAECFMLVHNSLLKLKEKIESKGKKLKDWDNEINYGIKSGYNEAFYIDGEKRKELINADKKNKEIIKPILRGRDINRYAIAGDKQFFLFIPWHFPLQNDNLITGASKKAETKFKEEYSAVYNHLSNFKKELSARNQAETGIRYEWYALQRCAATYFDDFDKEKIVWIVLSDRAKFAFDDEGYYTNDSTFFMTGKDLKFLLAVLNSKVSEWYFNFLAPTSGMGTTMWKKVYMEQIPIVETNTENKIIIERVVNYTIQERKLHDETAVFSFFEHLIDAMVYELYLSNEIKAADCEVLKNLTDLAELKEDWSNEKKLQTIEKAYKELSDPTHPVSVAMEKMQEIPEVKLIEGKK